MLYTNSNKKIGTVKLHLCPKPMTLHWLLVKLGIHDASWWLYNGEDCIRLYFITILVDHRTLGWTIQGCILQDVLYYCIRVDSPSVLAMPVGTFPVWMCEILSLYSGLTRTIILICHSASLATWWGQNIPLIRQNAFHRKYRFSRIHRKYVWILLIWITW